MPDELKPPVAIRITRPYATETEFLEREFDTLTHTGVTLLGAQTRPQGVVLRFEIVLKNGESVLRGEGRVVGFKEKAYAGEPGLVLRFTRLDSRSKSLVDRASALRDARVRASTSLMSMPAVVVPKATPPPAHVIPEPARAEPRPAPVPRPSSIPPPLPPRPSRVPPPLPAWAKPVAPPPSESEPEISVDVESTQVDAHFDPFPKALIEAAAPKRLSPPPLPVASEAVVERAAEPGPNAPRAPEPAAVVAPVAKPPVRPLPARPPPIPPVAPRTVPAATASPSPPAARVVSSTARAPRRPIERPAQRDELLTRLRERALALPPARVREILAKPP